MTHQLLSLFLLVLALVLYPSVTSADEYDEFETYDAEDEFEQKDEEDFETQKPTTKSSDEEEFVGSQKKADPTPKAPPTPPPRPPKWTDFGLEAVYVLLIVAYGIVYFVGSRNNDQLAALWGRTFKDLFDSNFAKVGAEAMIQKDTQNVFVLRATGRINCVGLQAVLELRKRHDLFFTFYQTFVKTRDRVTIDVAMDKMDPFIFAIVNNKDVKNYKANHKDVHLFTKPRKSDDEAFPDDRFTILSESEDLVPYLLPGPVVEALDSFADFIEVIHFSDQYSNNKVYKKILHFVFYVPTSHEEMENLRTLMNMVMYFIDHVSAINLSPEVKKKATERRTQANAELEKEKAEERQEMLRKKQEEKKKKDEERFKKMTPEQLAKEEAKQRRRELKRSSKVKVVFA